MQRTVTTPADLSGEALDNLKRWLAISRSGEDALLINLLASSLALCETFTGQVPVEQVFEERVPPTFGMHSLTTRPVQSLVSAELIQQGGARVALEDSDFVFEIDASGMACLELSKELEGRAVALSFLAGIAPDWTSLPSALKQGAVRLAAYHYRDRDSQQTTPPPASITALWRPWRAIRIV